MLQVVTSGGDLDHQLREADTWSDAILSGQRSVAGNTSRGRRPARDIGPAWLKPSGRRTAESPTPLQDQHTGPRPGAERTPERPEGGALGQSPGRGHRECTAVVSGECRRRPPRVRPPAQRQSPSPHWQEQPRGWSLT